MTVLKSDECFVSIKFFQAIDLKHSLRSFTSRHIYSDRILTACAQSQRVAWPNLRSGVIFLFFFCFFVSLAREGKKITPDTLI